MKTNREIAASFTLWCQYVDTGETGGDSRRFFDGMTIEERLQFMVDCGFGGGRVMSFHDACKIALENKKGWSQPVVVMNESHEFYATDAAAVVSGTIVLDDPINQLACLPEDLADNEFLMSEFI